MNYLLIGLLASIGWYLGKFIVIDIFGEIIYRRWTKTDLYSKLVKNPQNSLKPKTVKTKIGFYREPND